MRIASLLLSVSIFGCGNDNSLALEDLASRLGTVQCDKIFQCCTQAQITSLFAGSTQDGEPITTAAQCAPGDAALYDAFDVSVFQESVASARIEYDGFAAKQCLDQIEAESCSDYALGGRSNLGDLCTDFITPLVPDGGICLESYECVTNNCMGSIVSGNGQNTLGMCMPLPGLGEACTYRCQSGQYCDGISSICLALQPDGATCRLFSDCSGGTCVGDSTGEGVCASTVVCEPS
jgi:hypothetical protein